MDKSATHLLLNMVISYWRLYTMEKRTELIGIKVTPSTRAAIEEIASREARPISSQINLILEKYIKDYFAKEGLEK